MNWTNRTPRLFLTALLVSSAFLFSGSTRIETVKLVPFQKGYIWLWSEKTTSLPEEYQQVLNIREFQTFQEAMHFKFEEFPEFSLPFQRPLEFQESPLEIRPYAAGYKLVWSKLDLDYPVQFSFSSKQEAQFFAENIRRGHYCRSGYGHAFQFIP